jgi:hypothetical protein
LAQATTVSLAKFTTSVQTAVKAAMAKHPKFKVEIPQSISVSYLIRGFPAPEAILATATLAETQAFADEVAASVSGAHPELVASHTTGSQGAFISVGRHIIVGIPPTVQAFQIER